MGVISRLFKRLAHKQISCPKVIVKFTDDAKMLLSFEDAPIKVEFPNREEMIFPDEVWTVCYDPYDIKCVHNYNGSRMPTATLVAKGPDDGPPW